MFTLIRKSCSKCSDALVLKKVNSCFSSNFNKEELAYLLNKNLGLCHSDSKSLFCSACMDEETNFCKGCDSKLTPQRKKILTNAHFNKIDVAA